jgi:hypothetical protein
VASTEPALADLNLYLTDGFDGDRVIVRVNDKVVFDREGITTKKLYGLAQAVPAVQVPGDDAKIEVSIPDKKVVASFEVNLSNGSHVPVTLEGNRLLHSVLKKIGFM